MLLYISKSSATWSFLSVYWQQLPVCARVARSSLHLRVSISTSQVDKHFQPTYHLSMSLVSLPNQSHSHVLFSLPVDSHFSLDPPQRVCIALAFFRAEFSSTNNQSASMSLLTTLINHKSISAVPAWVKKMQDNANLGKRIPCKTLFKFSCWLHRGKLFRRK